MLLESGKYHFRHSTDHEHLFRQESFFKYLFGLDHYDCFAALHIETGDSFLFLPSEPTSFEVWKGKIQPPSYYEEEWGFKKCLFHAEYNPCIYNATDHNDLGEWAKNKDLYILSGINSDSGLNIKELTFSGIEHARSINKDILFEELSECRVIKSDLELDLMRHINKISSNAHIKVMQSIAIGMNESELESLFLHQVYSTGGCRFSSYTCICATGSNGSVLHYPQNSKFIKDGDMCLFDMGGEYNCYASDITCSFPANGKFTEEQKIIYNIVLDSQVAVLKAMKPGVYWSDMHRLANRVIVEGLLKHGFLKGDLDELIQNHIGSKFFCHGLGHLLGIDTHDVGGFPKNGPSRILEPGIRSLRTCRTLEEGMVITVEPGLYFNKYLLNESRQDSNISKYFNWDLIDKYIDFGGVRIEDNVIVTKTGCENMTLCPRTVEEIEKTMSGETLEFKPVFYNS